MHPQVVAKYGKKCLPQGTVYKRIEIYESRRISVVHADTYRRRSTSTNEKENVVSA
jgi:tRNA A37 threonylcarbamoyladenosine biosynthesis protein TsaE